jgi:uncharacterized protein (TIGR02996 family)
MTTEDDFHAALLAQPGDWQTRLVLADFLQERGDPRADGYRALGRLQKRPRPDSQETRATRRFITWFNLSRQEAERYHVNSLPDDWFSALEGGEQLSDEGAVFEAGGLYYGDWLDYPSCREAEDAAALAFARLPPARRAELMAAAPAG